MIPLKECFLLIVGELFAHSVQTTSSHFQVVYIYHPRSQNFSQAVKFVIFSKVELRAMDVLWIGWKNSHFGKLLVAITGTTHTVKDVLSFPPAVVTVKIYV